jgi:prophage antirepressor-like protein
MNNEERGTAQQSNRVIAFDFKGHTVRILFINGESWYDVADVCNVLGSDEHNLDDVDDQDKGWYSGYPTMFFVNESGLYRLILQSRKPEAEQFKTWVFDEILPKWWKIELVAEAWKFEFVAEAMKH